MRVHLWCCFPEGKEPFRHTTKAIFRLGDKTDKLKEIDAYEGVVFDSQGQMSPLLLFFFILVSPSHSSPFLFFLLFYTNIDITVLLVSFLNPITLFMLCIHTITNKLIFFKHYMNKVICEESATKDGHYIETN